MISELKDDEILDFLMTSDFSDDYSPEELKYLLFKWRNFYRVYHGRNERMKENYESELKTIQDKLDAEQSKFTDSLVQIADKQNLIDSMKNRKLTWKERLTGKIITKEDEN